MQRLSYNASKHFTNPNCDLQISSVFTFGKINSTLSQKSSQWTRDQRPITQGLRSLWLKSWEFYSRYNVDYNHAIMSQFCTYHDSWAVVVCAKLWHNLVIIFKSEQKEFLRDYIHKSIISYWNVARIKYILRLTTLHGSEVTEFVDWIRTEGQFRYLKAHCKNGR